MIFIKVYYEGKPIVMVSMTNYEHINRYSETTAVQFSFSNASQSTGKV